MKSLFAALALTLSTLALAHSEEAAKPDTHGKTSERLLDLT